MLDAQSFQSSDEPNQPLYLQISRWVEERIRSGELAPGTRLQPVRALAHQLGVNRGSVAHAYAHLTREGLLQGGPGRGTFVRAAPSIGASQEPTTTGEDFWQPLLVEVNSRLGAPKPAILDTDPNFEWVPENGSPSNAQARFAMDLPLSDHRLSYPLIKDALQRLAASLPRDALAYGHPQGLHSLRVQLAARARRHAMNVESREILVCNGTQQALSLVCSLLVQPGDAVVMANPGYPGASRVFRMFGAKILTIPLDDNGLKVDQFQAMLRDYRPKLVYTVPTFQVPTGTTLTHERRLKLYRLAEAHKVPIVEDEYANPLYYEEPPPQPIKALDRQGLVIYVGTFSKTLGAGLRLGWIAAHPAVLARLVQAKEAQDIHTSLISQLLVDSLLRDGAYDRHLETLRDHYGQRYRALLRALRKHFGSILKFEPSGGAFSIWAMLPESVSATRWLHFARARGVNFHRGTSYFLEGDTDRHAQLCFSQIDPDSIELAVEQLLLAFHEARESYAGPGAATGGFLPFS